MAFELLFDDLAAGAVFVALEGRGERDAQLVDQLFHRRGEPGALPRREIEPARLLRIGEIVHIAEVGRRRLRRRSAPQQILDQLVAAGAGRPQRVDVVPLLPHAQRELDRLGGAFLAELSRGVGQLAR